MTPPDSSHSIEDEIPRRQTLTAQAAHLIREGIAAGKWKQVLPGERTLCERLLISRTTLRSALHQLETEGLLSTSDRQRRSILSTGKPRSRQHHTPLVGLLSSMPMEAVSPLAALWVDSLSATLAKAGLQLERHVSPACFATRPHAALERLIRDSRATTWIVARPTEPIQQWFLQRQIPCVVAGSCAHGIELPSFDLNHRATCRHAAGLFLSKGHTSIALLIHHNGYGDLESESGFREAFTHTSHQCSAPIIIKHNGTVENLIDKLQSALVRKQAPTAFLVTRAPHALTVLTSLLQRGLTPPHKSALICRDDAPFLSFTQPEIARYVHSPSVYANRLSRAIIDLTRNETVPPRATRLMPRFVAGKTV